MKRVILIEPDAVRIFQLHRKNLVLEKRCALSELETFLQKVEKEDASYELLTWPSQEQFSTPIPTLGRRDRALIKAQRIQMQTPPTRFIAEQGTSKNKQIQIAFHQETAELQACIALLTKYEQRIVRLCGCGLLAPYVSAKNSAPPACLITWFTAEQLVQAFVKDGLTLLYRTTPVREFDSLWIENSIVREHLIRQQSIPSDIALPYLHLGEIENAKPPPDLAGDFQYLPSKAFVSDCTPHEHFMLAMLDMPKRIDYRSADLRRENQHYHLAKITKTLAAALLCGALTFSAKAFHQIIEIATTLQQLDDENSRNISQQVALAKTMPPNYREILADYMNWQHRPPPSAAILARSSQLLATSESWHLQGLAWAWSPEHPESIKLSLRGASNEKTGLAEIVEKAGGRFEHEADHDRIEFDHLRLP